MVNPRGWGSMNGRMDNFTKGSGSMVSNTGRGCGKELRVIVMLGSGEWVKRRAMECMYGSMETGMRASLKTVLKTVKEHRNLQTEICTKEST